MAGPNPPPHRRGSFLQGAQKNVPFVFSGPRRYLLSMRAGIALRAPRVPGRPPSADPSGAAQSWVGATALALRTLDPDFRGPARDELGTGM